MAVAYNPKTVTNGLVFSYDMGNTDKSWKGAPATNLTTYSQAVDTVNSWSTVATTITPNISLAPDGTLTADLLLDDTTYNNHGLSRNSGYGFTASSTYTSSVHLKKYNNGNYAYLWMDTGSGYGMTLEVNLTNGVIRTTRGASGIWSNASYTTTTLSNNWYRISITATTDSTNSFVQTRVYTSPTAWVSGNYGTPVNTGTGTDGCYIWGLQLENNAFATPYIPTTTAAASRSTTQALLDPIGKNTITATSLTYASNNTFSFNGTSDYVIPSNITDAMLNSNSWSLSCWIKFTNVNTGTDNPIATHGTPGITGGALHLLERAGYLYFGLYGIDLSGARAILAGTWYNVVFTYNYTSRLKTMYINGSYDNSYAHSGGYIGTGSNFKLGKAWDQATYLRASMPSVQFYTKELSADEVKQNFNALRGRYGI